MCEKAKASAPSTSQISQLIRMDFAVVLRRVGRMNHSHSHQTIKGENPTRLVVGGKSLTSACVCTRDGYFFFFQTCGDRYF